MADDAIFYVFTQQRGDTSPENENVDVNRIIFVNGAECYDQNVFSRFYAIRVGVNEFSLTRELISLFTPLADGYFHYPLRNGLPLINVTH